MSTAAHNQSGTGNATRFENGDLVINRTFNAPRELVWRAWTDPNMFSQWWGPKAYSAPVVKIDFREGGKWLAVMRDADGNDIWSGGTYKKIVPVEHITTTDHFADAEGNIVSSEVYGMRGVPMEMLITVDLEDVNGKTRMTLRHQGLPAGEHLEGASIGWNESLDKMEAIF
jgi:uncharacterized protein YndB with AHSA1/START domain